MDRDEFFEILQRRLLWETVCAHIESRNEADVILQKAGVENIAAECAEIQDTKDFFVMDVCESGGRIVIAFEMPFILCVNNTYHIEAMAAGQMKNMIWFFLFMRRATGGDNNILTFGSLRLVGWKI